MLLSKLNPPVLKLDYKQKKRKFLIKQCISINVFNTFKQCLLIKEYIFNKRLGYNDLEDTVKSSKTLAPVCRITS